MIFDASVDVIELDNNITTKEIPHERCKRNLAIFCYEV